MKLRMEPLDVQTNQQGKITGLLWNGKKYRVTKTHERWVWRGQWWTTPNLEGHRRSYFRVTVQNVANKRESTWEIYQQRGEWTLSRELD